jgi:hypothetical protein
MKTSSGLPKGSRLVGEFPATVSCRVSLLAANELGARVLVVAAGAPDRGHLLSVRNIVMIYGEDNTVHDRPRRLRLHSQKPRVLEEVEAATCEISLAEQADVTKEASCASDYQQFAVTTAAEGIEQPRCGTR